MLKILIVDNSKYPTGAIRSIVSVINSLHNNGFEFYFCSPRNFYALNNFISIDFKELTKSVRSILYLPFLVINSIRILRLIGKENIQVVHFNDLYNMCGVIIKLVRPHIKVAYHVRLLPSSYVKKLYKVWQYLILKFANEIICVSEAVASHWPKRENIHVIYDAVGSVENLPVRVINNSDTITFLYLANYIRGKGHDAALQAFSEVYRKNPNIRLRMVGGDMGLMKNREFKNSLIQYVATHQMNAVVSIEDFSENIEVLMKQADIFLNFSESESFSMTCLEALYFGTPCIATVSGGPSEIIENGVSGLLVPVGDISKMKEAMMNLASDVEKRKLFSINGRVRARSVFNIETQAAKLATIYSS